MPLLPSGLPDVVADAEDISRFLTQSGHYSNGMPAPSAFLPDRRTRNKSVFRFGADLERIQRVWGEVAPEAKPLRGAAVLKAGAARMAGLEVMADEPPLAHANLEGWTWNDSDPQLQKASQKEQALVLCKASKLLVF